MILWFVHYWHSSHQYNVLVTVLLWTQRSQMVLCNKLSSVSEQKKEKEKAQILNSEQDITDKFLMGPYEKLDLGYFFIKCTMLRCNNCCVFLMKGCIDIQVHLMNNYNDFSKLYRILSFWIGRLHKKFAKSNMQNYLLWWPLMTNRTTEYMCFTL